MTNAKLVSALLAKATDCDVHAAKTAERYAGIPHTNYDAQMAAATRAEADRVGALTVDLEAIYALDKKAVQAVPEADLAEAIRVSHNFCCRAESWGVPAFGFVFAEATRRKAAATRLANTINRAAGCTYADGQAVQVHAFGHWYAGKVVRTTRTGSVVVEYTSGTGTTRQKTCTQDLVRAA